LHNDGGRTSKVEEEEMLPAMVSMLAKKTNLLVVDMNGLMLAIFHKQKALTS
jgi:50S ribosomal subunit-associated GTPase HflX